MEILHSRSKWISPQWFIALSKSTDNIGECTECVERNTTYAIPSLGKLLVVSLELECEPSEHPLRERERDSSLLIELHFQGSDPSRPFTPFGIRPNSRSLPGHSATYPVLSDPLSHSPSLAVLFQQEV